MEEIEVKFVDIDVSELKEKLLQLGAVFNASFHYKRTTFDYPDWRLNSDHSWLRLRTDGTTTTLAYKKRINPNSAGTIGSDGGMHEVEIVVDDFNKTKDLLFAIGFVVKRSQENKRERYIKENVEFDIDYWPQLPPYLEIEGKSWEEVHAAATELGFDPKNGLRCSTKQVYKQNGINEDEYREMLFNGFTKV